MHSKYLFSLITIIFIFLALLQVKTLVLAEQSGSSPESGATSRIKTIYDSLVSLTHGSDSAGSWGDWGSMWNRIRSAGEWVPTGDADEADVTAGKNFYKDSRTPKTGAALSDYSTQSKVTWDDAKNGSSADGDDAGEESLWSNTAGLADTGVWKDMRTGLYWSNIKGNMSNSFTAASCDFYLTSSRGTYAGGDDDCGEAINACATLSLEAVTSGSVKTDWYLPSQKELQQAYINGVYNNTSATFASSAFTLSSTEDSGDSSKAWGERLSNGHSWNPSKDSASFSVRCVRRD